MTRPTRDLTKLYPHDYILRVVILPFIPKFVHPNHITVLRFLMTPLVLWLLFTEHYTWGVPLFIVAAITDAVDGSLARVRKQVTPWGIFFDPIADKFLIGSIALVVALQYFNPVTVFAALSLDMLPSLRWASTKYAGTVMAANAWGKSKMFLQFCSLTLLLLGIMLDVPILIDLGELVLLVSLVFASIAVITYSL
ncbi:MAG: CDP-alcohol phosphatidyltransferase family protein [Patescibacteria group bacterium]